MVAGHGYYVPFLAPPAEGGRSRLAFADFKKEMAGIFADARVRKSGHNLKFDMLHLLCHGMEVKGVEHDTMIMSYLLFPNRRSHQLKELSSEFLGVRQTTYEELVGKGKAKVPLAEVEVARVGSYCFADADCSQRLVDRLLPQLEEKKLLELYRDIEIPLAQVLLEMEWHGILVDRAFLQEADVRLRAQIVAAEKEVRALAGYDFNLNSPQQLAELLFDKMNLPLSKKTRKTGAQSTDIEVLNELKGYPVVEKIIAHRTYKKLHSTYVQGLLENLDGRDRVHTQFNQTVTATGRLSSSNPNLQNIPVGEIAGLNLRRAFVADPGCRLLSADYSQIELRVMAHFSGDDNLLRAFAEGADIHQRTADLVFGADLFSQGHELRRRAKIINFSIIYGTGPYSLAKELGVSYTEAKEFIARYFETYVGVKRFIDGVIAEAEKDPEVRTLSGRVRPIPEIQSANRAVKENGNRMAINSIIQGSAADIIKIAMIRIHEHLRSMESRLVLQVHDELVFEYPLAEEKRLAALVKKEMEHAVALKAPLQVSLKHGKNWADMTGAPFHSMKEIDAPKFKEIIKRGMEHLFRDRDLLNRINVFPVADGDTGDNLVHTLKPAYDKMDAISESRVDDLTSRLAQVMLMSAKGNSGVIFSQFFYSFAGALQGKAVIDPADFSLAMEKAVHRDLRVDRRAQGGDHPDRPAAHGGGIQAPGPERRKVSRDIRKSDHQGQGDPGKDP